MSKKSFFVEHGIVMLLIPAGLMFIVGIVFGLFLGARDTPSPKHLPTGYYDARA